MHVHVEFHDRRGDDAHHSDHFVPGDVPALRESAFSAH